MTDTLRMLVAGGIVLGILVLLHEWGHFIVAKWCGVRVDVFSIGFGPRLWGVKRGDTDYRISALPLGGYVRMAGDNPVEERTGAAYEFLSRPRWQRCLIAIAGPTMNILLTFVVFMGIFWLVGIPTPSISVNPRRSRSSARCSADKRAGRRSYRQGERVRTPTWKDVFAQSEDAKPGDSLALVVARNGSEIPLTLAVGQKTTGDDLFGYPAMRPVLDEVSTGTPADKAGMQTGDLIKSIDGMPVVTWPQLVDRVRGSDGHEIQL